MDFFERQDDARRRSKRLVILFGLAVVAIIGVLYGVATLVRHGFGITTLSEVGSLWDPGLFLSVATAALVVVGSGSLFKILELRGGGDKVARLLGGDPLDVNTRDAQERRLLNVVEEMAIASGVPVPPVYVLRREGAINAFAAGHTQGDAVIGVTRGCLDLLDREELQGVIGHEFSHILNGDMRLNLRLIGVLHGILAIAVIGRLLWRGAQWTIGSGEGKRGGPGAALAVAGIALFLIGSVGAFFGRWIKSAVSRQREFLADASAVQFTRDPGGLAGALKKIGGLSLRARLNTPRAEEASHLFFGDAVGHRFFSTHPPLEERVRLLEPGFQGEFDPVEPPPEWVAEREAETAEMAERARRARQSAATRFQAPPPSAALSPEAWLEGLGSLDALHIAYAATLLESVPRDVMDAAHEPSSARAVVLALLASHDPAVRERQLGLVAAAAGEDLAAETSRLTETLAKLAEEQRLPLIDLVVPSLVRMSARQYATFRVAVRDLIQADDRLSLFEYALERHLERHLRPRFGPARAPVAQYYSLKALDDECRSVLGALAWCGGGRDHASSAFGAGAAVVAPVVGPLRLPEETECSLEKVDEALGRLRLLVPRLKRTVLHAAATVVAHDASVTVEEGELLRAIADSLDTPAPPLLPGQRLVASVERSAAVASPGSA